MSKNERQHWIKVKENAKYVGTKPEREMEKLLDEMHIPYVSDRHTNVEGLNRKGQLQTFRFQLDFCVPEGFDSIQVTAIEVNGEGHKDKNDEWQSNLMLDAFVEENGYQIAKVINFDSELLKLKKHRPLAIAALRKALLSTDRIVWVDA